MSAATRLRPPSRLHVARGSAVGLGLLVASTAFAPAALAADDPSDPVAPDVTPHAPAVAPVALNPSPAGSAAVSQPISASFGTGKQFDLAVAVDGDVPADLSLTGARFALTDAHGTLAATCATDSHGACTIHSGVGAREGSNVYLADGAYTVTQVSAVDGLVPVSGTVGTLTMDSNDWFVSAFTLAPDRKPVAITNVAQFSQKVTAAVVDAAGDPLPDADFSLTGAAYPGAAEAYDSGTVTSDADGLLTFDGWFWPGHWTLTPLRVPAGSALGDPLLLVVPPTPGFHAPATWAVADPIAVLSSGVSQQGPSADPSTPPAPPVVVPPVVVPPVVGPSVVVPPAAPTSSAPRSAPASPARRSAAPVAQVPAAPSPEPSPEPVAVPTATYDGRSALPQDDRSPNTDPAPALVAEPQLQTASSSLPEVGLVGIGVLFVAVVATGVVFLRRRMLRG